MMNPVRAGLVENFLEYPWSSANCYDQEKSLIVDRDYIRGLFGSRRNYISQVQGLGNMELQILQTDMGEVIGDEEFGEVALERFDRRSGEDNFSRKRMNDRYFEPVEKVIQEFEEMKGTKIEEIDIDRYSGKRLRGELLVYLKENCGLTYAEIAEISIFSNVQMTSLGKLYQDAPNDSNKEVKHRVGGG